MSLYVGINNSPRAITGLLIGSNGVKEVQSAYTGGVNSRNKVYDNFNLNKINPVKELTSGKITAADISKTVYLSNSATSCQEWLIADVNHDGTSGTVDLFPKYLLASNEMTSSSSISYLDAVLNGFTSEVQNAIKVQEWKTRNHAFGYTSDNDTSTIVTGSGKIVRPSVEEVNSYYWGFKLPSYGAGDVYPLFHNTYGLDSRYYGSSYWVRGYSYSEFSQSGYNYQVSSASNEWCAHGATGSATANVIGRIRF